MNNQGWKKILVCSAGITAWLETKGVLLVSAAEQESAEDGMMQGAHPAVLQDTSGIFGSIMITDIVLCVLFALCVLLGIMLARRISIYDNDMRHALEGQKRAFQADIAALQREVKFMQQPIEKDTSADVIAEGLRVRQERQYTRESMFQDIGIREVSQERHEVRLPVNEAVRPSRIEEFLRDYHSFAGQNLSGLAVKQAREAIGMKYKVRAFSCKNAADRAYQPALAPDYLTVDNPGIGDYWAVCMDGRDTYAVVPNPKVTYEAQIHSSGGMKEAFASNYHGGSFEHIQVVIPAEFSCVNHRWTVLKPGKIIVS